MKQFVQGDVIFVEIDKIPSVRLVESQSNVIARGEKTGHAHVLSGLAKFFPAVSGVQLGFVASEGGSVTHDEHGELNLPVGNYQVRQQRVYDYEAARQRQIAERKVED